jgi:tRNA pseudouridine55 synthase
MTQTVATSGFQHLTILLPGTALPVPFPAGALFLVDKPLGWTSFDVVNKIRHHLGKRLGVKRPKVGHAGTLDPLATGLLLVCVGDHTKKIDLLQAETKRYTGTITFGAVTASYDLEKPPAATFPTEHLTADLLETVRQQFLGPIEQIPPMYSAVKIDGRRLYKNARTGQTVTDVEPRSVTIHELTLGALRPVGPVVSAPVVLSNKGAAIYQYPEYAAGLQIDFAVTCSKGTYIRSLAYDLGEAAHSGAYLSALRRTGSGDFSVNDAWSVEALVKVLAEG